jgi:hypothetical protein
MSDTVEFVVVGLNSIGRTLAGLIAISNLGPVTLIDDKKVSAKCTASGYLEIDVGQYRVDATADAIKEISPKAKINKFMRLDNSTIETFTSKINGNTIMLCCDSMSDRSRIHICTEMKNSCQEIYFFGFNEKDGSCDITCIVPGIYNLEKILEDIPNGKEVPEEGKLAAAKVFALQVNSI